MAKRSVKERAKSASRPLTIYDRGAYFDAKFSDAEITDLRVRILSEFGIADGSMWLFLREIETSRELCHALHVNDVPRDWTLIHICRQLEIDYKSFAKNVPKLPIEPFYQFAESLFPHFKPAKNKLQLDVQTHHIRLAFLDWVETACPESGCKRSEHMLWGCADRFEKPDYATAAKRIWARNKARPKFVPLRLVYSV